jgi:hypothetical protein
VEITPIQDYWDQNPSFRLTQTFYDLQMKHFDPADDPKTANFTVMTPEEARRDSTASASSDQASCHRLDYQGNSELILAQGNVSWKLPAVQVGFPVGGTAPVHNGGFRELAGTVSAASTPATKFAIDL